MVNFGLNTASFLGIILALAGAGLYFLRSFRPELSRDQDIAFTAIGIICGFILIFQGWRLDPILQFGQLLLSGSTIFFAYENIKLRGITTEQAKGKSQIVDEDRPVSRQYKAEVENREYLDDRPRNSRRIRGEENRRNNQREDSENLPQRRSVRELPDDRETATTPRRRRIERDSEDTGSLARRSTRDESRSSYDDRWDDENDDREWNDSAPRQSRRALPSAQRDNLGTNPARRSTRREDPEEQAQTPPRRQRRPRPENPAIATNLDQGSTANYVEYEPIADANIREPLDPPSGLPESGSDPIVFPDRY